MLLPSACEVQFDIVPLLVRAMPRSQCKQHGPSPTLQATHKEPPLTPAPIS